MSKDFGDEDGPEPLLETLPARAAKLHADSPLHEAIADDIVHYSFILEALRVTWGAARTVDDVCKMSLTTAKILEMRRKAMMLPTEAAKGSGSTYLEPPDDEIPAAYIPN